MSRFNWHVARKGESPKVIRHYKHIKMMFRFVLRNPAMFGGRELTIYDHGHKVTDISWSGIKHLMEQDLSEVDTRDIIRGRKKLEDIDTTIPRKKVVKRRINI